ncbi:MAG: PaaI family thioesterase [Bacteroidetes bacterium]|nr:PaaI family thioesterase [Bacteroidota bacterium]MBS1776324.1 PaaI family thioesterase [Bacteroidota bacterium]
MEEQQESMLEYMKRTFLNKQVVGSRSPAGNWLQFTLNKVERGIAEIELIVREDMCNPYGNIHGGMMSLLIDEVIGWSVASLSTQQNYTSLNLNVDFLYAIHRGEHLRAIAKVVREGKKVIHVSCEVFDQKGRILAKASSNLIVTGMKPEAGTFRVAN